MNINPINKYVMKLHDVDWTLWNEYLKKFLDFMEQIRTRNWYEMNDQPEASRYCLCTNYIIINKSNCGNFVEKKNDINKLWSLHKIETV